MKKTKKSIVFVLCLAMILSMAACNTAKDSTTEGNTDIPKRDDVIVAIGAPPANLDTNMYQTTTDYFVSPCIFDYLFRYDSLGNIFPSMAEKVEQAADGMSITVTIKKGIKFHDGTEVTADDVVFSFNRYAATGAGQGFMAYISTTLEKVDDYTVKLAKNYPAAKAEDCLAFVPIVPKAAVEMDAAAFDKAPIGCGPYKFVSYENNELITLEAFEDYFGGKPAIKTLKAKVISDPSTAAIALEAGEIDVLYNVSSMDVANLETTGKFFVDKSPSTMISYVEFKAGELMTNKKLREALFHAINPEDALIAGADGDGIIATDLFAPFTMGNLSGLVPYSDTFDIELAKSLLVESGFDTSKKIILTTTNFVATGPKTVQSVANNLKAIGIDTEIEVLDINTYFERYMTGDFEILVAETGGALFNAQVLLNFYTTTGDYFGMNNPTEKSPEFDALVAAASFAVTEEDVKATGQAMLEAFKEKYLMLPLFVPNSNVVFNSSLKGVKANIVMKPNPQEWSY
jgi:peptide/nickel transport system substrate-binding protein